MSERMHLIQKKFFKEVIATQSISASSYSILTYQINYSSTPIRQLIFQQFSNPPPPPFILTPSLLSLEEFSTSSPIVYSNCPSISHSRVLATWSS